ncbi:MAG: nucleoside triphosphate pyrophosphohydrolase [Chloroflexi bacterium]|nr:nucleoside triphosphate pyrophosphohydrolase [Chloroflexota bacterium]
MTLTIVGLGPGPIDDLSRRAWRVLENARLVYLRTTRHPCVPLLPPNARRDSFDAVYESERDFAQVYATICAAVLEAAQRGDVVYAVPGDPLVGEATVTRLLAAAKEAGITVEIVSGISFVEPSLALLGIDALDGLQVLDGLTVAAMHHPPLNPDLPALLGQVYSREVASNVKLTLMNQYPEEFTVTLLHGAGTEQARAEQMPLYAIDRSEHIDHLTSLFVPALGDMSSFQQFEEIIAHLRAPEGCPWDRKQTHQSLRPYLIEEAYEVLEAIDAGDWQALSEELGDLMLQAVLHTQIAVDEGEFRMTDVLRQINNKLIRRHPHVWGDTQVSGAEQVLANWDTLKKQEHAAKGTARASLLDGVPKGLPALMQAYQYRQKAAKIGFDWEKVEDVAAKVREEIAEIAQAQDSAQTAEEVGDLLFVLVNWAHWLGVSDPEGALRAANAKFYRRFRYIEAALAQNGAVEGRYPLAQLDALWNEAKTKGL